MTLTRHPIAVPVVVPSVALAAADAVFVDLRSPSEFAEDHLPGARNLPLFDDVERAVIGTLFAQSSPEAAFAEGRERTREKIGELTRAIAATARWAPPDVELAERVDELTAKGLAGLQSDLALERRHALPSGAVVLYCWRGGLRSTAIVAFMRGLGLERAFALEGGYKAYRRGVRERIARWSPPPGFVLRGLTGVGKTLVLRGVERLRPGWTLDLEALAGHRSSVLGMVGLEPCTQKTFETRLVQRLERGFAGPCLVEGESRKVGDVVLPEPVWSVIREGTSIELVAPTERRVQLLIEDYLGREENRAAIAAQLPFIEERLGRTRWEGRLVELLATRREHELVEILLRTYYDPLYRHSEGAHAYATTIESHDVAHAARAVVKWIEDRRGRRLTPAVTPGNGSRP